MDANPYNPPSADLEQQRPVANYGGIGRLTFTGLIAVACLAQIGTTALGVDALNTAVSILALVAVFAGVVYRLRNIGSNRFWSLLFFVPPLNVALMFRCIAFPEGYRDTRALDTPGKIIATVVVVLILGLLAYILDYDSMARSV